MSDLFGGKIDDVAKEDECSLAFGESTKCHFQLGSEVMLGVINDGRWVVVVSRTQIDRLAFPPSKFVKTGESNAPVEPRPERTSVSSDGVCRLDQLEKRLLNCIFRRLSVSEEADGERRKVIRHRLVHGTERLIRPLSDSLNPLVERAEVGKGHDVTFQTVHSLEPWLSLRPPDLDKSEVREQTDKKLPFTCVDETPEQFAVVRRVDPVVAATFGVVIGQM